MILASYRLIRAFSGKLRDDSISAFAAQAAFFIILSVFPFLMFLLTLLNYLPIPLSDCEDFVISMLPALVSSFVSTILYEVSFQTSGTLLSITMLAALWSASRGVLALSRGLNSVYGYRETRNYFHVRAISTLYTLVFALLLIVTLILLVFGNQLYLFIVAHIPFLLDAAFLILSMRTIIVMLILTFFFLLLYSVLPNRRSTLFRELPGAILSAGGWLGFSYLFSFYIDHMSSLSATYGSLTAVVVCMLWLYACMYIVFIGAEINNLLAHPRIAEATRRFFSNRKK